MARFRPPRRRAGRRGGRGVRIEGLRETEKALLELKSATARNVVERVLKRRAQPIADDMSERAPRLVGTLAESKAVGKKLSKRQRSKHRKESDVEIFAGVGPVAEAIAQEFGTFKEPPQPFARPAWVAGKEPAIDGIADDMREEVAKAAKRARRKAARVLAKMGRQAQ